MKNKHYGQWNKIKLKEVRTVKKQKKTHVHPLNQILHMPSYITHAVSNANRQITFHQHIHGLCCLMRRLVAAFAKRSTTLICHMVMYAFEQEMNQLPNILDAGKNVARKNLRKR